MRRRSNVIQILVWTQIRPLETPPAGPTCQYYQGRVQKVAFPARPSQPSQPSQPAPKYPTSSRPRNLFEINENQWFWDHFRPAEQNLQNIIPWRAFAHGFLCTCSFTIGLDKPKFSTPCVHPDTCLRTFTQQRRQQRQQQQPTFTRFSDAFLCTCTFTIGLVKPKFSTPYAHSDTCLHTFTKQQHQQRQQQQPTFTHFSDAFLCTCTFTIGLVKPKFSTPCAHS